MMYKKTLTTLVLLAAGLSVIAGCATTKKIANDIMGHEGGLKKKIAFLPVINRSGFGGSDLARAASAKLATLLSTDCQSIVAVNAAKVRQALEAMPRLPSGEMDHLGLAQFGRVWGVNAVIEQTISDVQFVTKKRGIWGFRQDTPFIQAAFRIRVYDIETTATIMDEVFREELELSEGPWAGQAPTAAYNKAYAGFLLDEILPRVTNAVCEGLSEMPWSGFVISRKDSMYTLSAGKDVGLAEGDILEVFEMADPIQGFGDHVYLMAGDKMGEVKITHVKDHQSQAVSLSGSGFEKSCCVRLKPS